MASSFDTLPDDLLFEIFSKCLPLNPWGTTPDPSKAPNSLTLVCKRWRSIALGFPSLWSWMRLHITRERWNLKNPGVERRTLRRFGEILGRSKPGPVNIMLSTRHLCLESLATPSFLSDLLLPMSSSLTRLVLHKVPFAQVRPIPQGLFPSLQSLVCNIAGAGVWLHRSDVPGPVMAFADAPSLRRVALDTMFIDDTKTAFVLPWNQLTHFRESDMHNSYATLFTQRLITQSSNLQWLGLEVRDEDCDTWPSEEQEWTDAFGSNAVVMEGVTTLSFGFDWGCEIGGLMYPVLLEKVEFPNLQTLRFSALEASNGLGPYEDLFMAWLKTLKKLEFLSLNLDSTDTHTLESILKCVPTVRTLHFSTNDTYGHLFRCLASKEHLLPCLETLVLDVGADQAAVANKIPTSALFYLLDARKAGNHPTSRIRRVAVWGTKPADVDDTQLFVGVIRRFMEGNGATEFVFDRHVGKVEEREAAMWMEMDPGSRGWEEAGAAENFISVLQSGDSSSVEDEDEGESAASDVDGDS